MDSNTTTVPIPNASVTTFWVLIGITVCLIVAMFICGIQLVKLHLRNKRNLSLREDGNWFLPFTLGVIAACAVIAGIIGSINAYGKNVSDDRPVTVADIAEPLGLDTSQNCRVATKNLSQGCDSIEISVGKPVNVIVNGNGTDMYTFTRDNNDPTSVDVLLTHDAYHNDPGTAM